MRVRAGLAYGRYLSGYWRTAYEKDSVDDSDLARAAVLVRGRVEVRHAGGANGQNMPAALANGSFIHFIGVCEVLGVFGLVLPGLMKIKPGLTPLAASGLVIITIGATVLSIPHGVAMAAFP